MARIASDPTDRDAWVMLAEVAMHGGQPSNVADILAKATARGGDSLKLRCLDARACLMMGRRADARERALALADERPGAAIEADTIGVLLVHVDAVEAAIPLLERAVALEPDRLSFNYNLATSLQFAGRIEESRQVFERILAAHPEHGKVLLGWVQVGGGSASDLERLEAMMGQAQDPVQRLQIGHAAAKIAEREGNDLGALAWLERAKAAYRARLTYDRDWVDRLYAAALSRLDAAAIEAAATPSDESGPLFVLGMPRSGTTLVERILGSHPDIRSAGEIGDFSMLTRQMSDASGDLVLSPELFESRIDLERVGEAYRQQTAPLQGDAAYLIDKMPFNFFYLPLLLQALPEARVVIVRRADEDVAIANYRQLFSASFGYYEYHADLDWTAHFVARAQRMLDLYVEKLEGPRVRSVAYEDVAANLEGAMRPVIEWLGLDWREEIRDFHARGASVTTASSVQVREPVHRRSVERWKRYGDTSDRLAQRMKEERAAAAALLKA